MLKEFFEWFLSKTEPQGHDIYGQTFCNQPLHLIKAPTPSALTVRNLTGLIDYLKTNYDNQAPVLVHVASPTEVNVFSTFNPDMNRSHLLQASALLPSIPFKQFLSVEEFNILLQSCFVNNEDRAQLLRVVGNIKDENVATFGDNGVSQQVTVKAGVANVENIEVPNPVKLKPFRTFIEIEQPESEFVFRMQTGPKAALFEADGGAWKLEGIHSIRDYLQVALDQQIEDGKVTIIA